MSEIPVTHIHIARVVIEFTTPFHIGSGREGIVSDASVITDANGLPSIPGSSLTGVLRAAFGKKYDDDDLEDKLFGHPGKTGKDKVDGKGSRLTISWGCIHDCMNQPVEGIVGDARLKDSVLANAYSPTLRDHVRINHQGASFSEDRAKFDELAVCAGHRFTFECSLQGVKEDEEQLWKPFLDILREGSLRIGGKTRRGFGAFKIIDLSEKIFNLGDSADFDTYSKMPVRLVSTTGILNKSKLDSVKNSLGAERTITLEPLEYWMFGGGYDVSNDSHEADMAPVRDRRIIWNNGKAKVESDVAYIPGSSVKGAISHRTAYHYNRLTGQFGDEMTEEKFTKATTENKAVRELFGYAKNNDKDEGQRGRIIIDDMFLNFDPKSQLVHHVAIDRFTGGARSGGLFSERPFWKGPNFELKISITEPEKITDNKTRQALDAALEDLGAMRLPLGGGSSRGLGFFKKVNDTGWKGWKAPQGGDTDEE
ncbi:hypothetical protein K8T06_03660 [bacterium]|nr:hypothetical protein [bacterium]